MLVIHKLCDCLLYDLVLVLPTSKFSVCRCVHTAMVDSSTISKLCLVHIDLALLKALIIHESNAILQTLDLYSIIFACWRIIQESFLTHTRS